MLESVLKSDNYVKDIAEFMRAAKPDDLQKFLIEMIEKKNLVVMCHLQRNYSQHIDGVDKDAVQVALTELAKTDKTCAAQMAAILGERTVLASNVSEENIQSVANVAAMVGRSDFVKMAIDLGMGVNVSDVQQCAKEARGVYENEKRMLNNIADERAKEETEKAVLQQIQNVEDEKKKFKVENLNMHAKRLNVAMMITPAVGFVVTTILPVFLSSNFIISVPIVTAVVTGALAVAEKIVAKTAKTIENEPSVEQK